MIGWRAKIGVLVPSVNKTMEPELYKMVPEGVSLHFSRIKEVEDTVEELSRMIDDIPRASSLLADASVDVIAFGCTAGSFVRGKGYDAEVCRRIWESTHIKATSTSSAILSALQELRLSKISIASPYMKEIVERAKNFFETQGYQVVKIKGLECPGPEIANIHPEQVYTVAREVDSDKSDGIVISCTDLRTIDIIEELESDLQKPVITSNQATMWAMLRLANVRSRIDGYGSLLNKL